MLPQLHRNVQGQADRKQTKRTIQDDHMEDDPIKHSEPVILVLDGNDLEHQTNNEFQPMFSMLCEKMRTKCIKSFSLKFEKCSTLRHANMHRPFDVKISYNYKLILVTDYKSKTLLMFDLISKVFKYAIQLPSNPHYLCIESVVDREGQVHDAAILTCSNHCIYKVDIRQCIKTNKFTPLWRSGQPGKTQHFNTPCGLVVMHRKKNEPTLLPQQQHDENLVFVCDLWNNQIKILGTKSGNLLESISQMGDITLSGPWIVDINHQGDLVVAEYCKRVQVIRRVGNGWVSILQVGNTPNCSFLQCCGVVMDRTTHNILLCDRDNHAIQVINGLNGQLVTTFKDRFDKPRGICIDEWTGQLLVADCENKMIRFYK